MGKKRKTMIQCRISPGLMDSAKTTAWRNGVTLTEYIREALAMKVWLDSDDSLRLVRIQGEKIIEVIPVDSTFVYREIFRGKIAAEGDSL